MLRDFGGDDSLGYFATRRDKSVLWDTGAAVDGGPASPDRVVGSVSLASGNPLGDPLRWPEAIEAWRRQARDNGWSLAVMGAGNRGGVVLATEAGLKALEIGDEAILDVRELRPDAGAGSAGPVRQAVAGSSAPATRPGAAALGDLGGRDGARSWRWPTVARRRRRPNAASRWRSAASATTVDGRCVLVEAYDAEAGLRGLLSVTVGRQRAVAGPDAPRPQADNGLIELMVTELIGAAAPSACSGVAELRGVPGGVRARAPRIGAGPMLAAWRQVLVLASRWSQLESLYRSNVKYQPEWLPRYLCFEYTSDLAEGRYGRRHRRGLPHAPEPAALLNRRGKAGGSGRPGAGRGRVRRAGRGADPRGAATPSRLALAADRLPEQERVRRDKADRLRARGIDPYPVTYPRTHTLAEVVAAHPDLPPDTSHRRRSRSPARVIRKRDGGGSASARCATAAATCR